MRSRAHESVFALKRPQRRHQRPAKISRDRKAKNSAVLDWNSTSVTAQSQHLSTLRAVSGPRRRMTKVNILTDLLPANLTVGRSTRSSSWCYVSFSCLLSAPTRLCGDAVATPTTKQVHNSEQTQQHRSVSTFSTSPLYHFPSNHRFLFLFHCFPTFFLLFVSNQLGYYWNHTAKNNSGGWERNYFIIWRETLLCSAQTRFH